MEDSFDLNVLTDALGSTSPDSTHPKLKAIYEGFSRGLEKIVAKQNLYLNFADWVKRQKEILSRVCRIDIDGAAAGTGFLVGPAAVLTNYHVIESVRGCTRRISCRFDYTSGARAGRTCALSPTGVIATSPYSPLDVVPDPKADPDEAHLDFALLQLAEPLGSARGWFSLPSSPHAFPAGSALFIVQHPDGDVLQVALDTQAIIGLNGNRTRVRYRTNTLPGSSGSPCFSSGWDLIALHHAGDPKVHKDGQRFGLYNEGIPLHRIHEMLQSMKHAAHVPPFVGTPVESTGEPIGPAAKPEGAYQLVYYHASNDTHYGDELKKHLKGLVQAGLLSHPWTESMIAPGSDRQQVLQQRWREADLIVILVSADMLAEGDQHLLLAKQRHAEGATVIPVVVRPAVWTASWLGKLQAYPQENNRVKPISKWSDPSEGWVNVLEGIQSAIEQRRSTQG